MEKTINGNRYSVCLQCDGTYYVYVEGDTMRYPGIPTGGTTFYNINRPSRGYKTLRQAWARARSHATPEPAPHAPRGKCTCGQPVDTRLDSVPCGPARECAVCYEQRTGAYGPPEGK